MRVEELGEPIAVLYGEPAPCEPIADVGAVPQCRVALVLREHAHQLVGKRAHDRLDQPISNAMTTRIAAVSWLTGARLGVWSTAAAVPAESADERVPAESTDPSDPTEPIENADAADPIEPMESTEPTDPIDSTEPLHPMHSKDSSDQSDQRESSMPPVSASDRDRVPFRLRFRHGLVALGLLDAVDNRRGAKAYERADQGEPR
jgi:hypothetical protein